MVRKTCRLLGGVLAFFGALAITAGSANADVNTIYQANRDNSSNGLNFGPDGTPNPPTSAGYWEMGNTITFGGTARDLQTVSLWLYGGGDVNYPIQMDLYSGNNPNTGALLGSATAPAGFGTNDTTFNFNGLVVPNKVTFILSLPDQTGSYDSIFLYPVITIGATGPTIGSGPNSLWYGTPGSFVSNDTYAIADGALNNYLSAQFNATPEPGFYGILALGLSGLVTVVRRRKRA